MNKRDSIARKIIQGKPEIGEQAAIRIADYIYFTCKYVKEGKGVELSKCTKEMHQSVCTILEIDRECKGDGPVEAVLVASSKMRHAWVRDLFTNTLLGD